MQAQTKPGQKKPGEKRTPEGQPVRKRDGDAENDADDAGNPSREAVINRWTNPVTNQDEQDKITNSGGDGIPMADK